METKPTGSESSEDVGTPWADKWNEVKATITQEVVEPIQKALGAPWETMWGGTRKVAPKAAVAPPSASTSLSGDWDAINKNYAQGQGDRNKAQLEILNNELANEKDPKNIPIRKREIARVTKMMNGGG
jgi:hypothetical protein